MDSLSLITAADAIDLFAGVLFAIAYLRRREVRDNGLAGILSFAAAAHATGIISLPHVSGHFAALAVERAAWLGLVAALPLAVHVAIASGEARSSRGTLAALYSIAAAWALLDLLVLPHPAASTPVLRGGAPYGSLSIATGYAPVVAAVAIIAFAAKAYLAVRREALALVVGGTALLATALHDLGAVSGDLSTGPLIDVGLAAFIASFMTTRSARFAAVSAELERRMEELRTRTGELLRSYDDLRATQEELVKKEQLAAVGELAAVIAHEVRNPLAIIANAVSGLRKQSISRQDHETLLAILEEETSRLNRLVTDLLRYARPVSVQRSDFSLADILDRALTLVSKDRKGIKTELQIAGHDGRIWGDANLLRQVFDNLVVNAVQAMGSGGSLTVRVRALSEDGVDGVAVDIIDTGEGMDTQVRTRARDPFFTTRPSGTGLGLAIVDRIVDAHGGYLAIDSRTGEGTTVTVFLPTGSPAGPLQPRSRTPKTRSAASA